MMGILQLQIKKSFPSHILNQEWFDLPEYLHDQCIVATCFLQLYLDHQSWSQIENMNISCAFQEPIQKTQGAPHNVDHLHQMSSLQ